MADAKDKAEDTQHRLGRAGTALTDVHRLCPRAGEAGAEKGSRDTIGNLIFTSCSKNKQGVNDFWRFYFARGKIERGIHFQI